MSRSPVEFLRDAREHAWQASKYGELSTKEFAGSEAAINAIYHLVILGEALRNVPSPIRSLAPDIPWRLVIGMRDVLIHRYWRIDLATVHRVLTDDLPPLIRSIDALAELIRQNRS